MQAHGRCGTVRYWHPREKDVGTRGVGTVSFSQDSRRLLTSGGISARVWDIETGREVLVLRDGERPIHAALHVPGGLIVTASGAGGAVTLWEATTGEVLSRWGGFGHAVRALALSPDGHTLLAGCEGPECLVVFDLRTGTLVKRLQLENSFGPAYSLSFSPDGTLALVLEASLEPVRLCVFETTGWSLLWSREGYAYGHPWAVFSEDSAFIHTRRTGVEWRCYIRTHAARTGESVAEVEVQREAGPSLPLPDGRKVRLLPDRLLVYRGACLERWMSLPGDLRGDDRNVAVSPDGRWASFARDDSSVVLLDLETRRMVPEHAHRTAVSQLTFSKDEPTVLSTFAQDGSVRAWFPQSGREVGCRSFSGTSMDSVQLSGGRVFEVSHLQGGRLLVDFMHHTEVELVSSRNVASAAWSDDRFILAELVHAGPDMRLRVCDTRDGRCLWNVLVESGDASLHAVSRTGARVVTVGDELPGGFVDLRLWDLSLGARWRTLRIPRGQRTWGFTPDEGTLVLEAAPGVLSLVEFAYPERRVHLRCASRFWTLAFAEQGTLLATGDTDGRVQVWSIDGRLLASLEGHRGTVTALAFSPRGDFLASGGADAVALIWPSRAWEG
ncbi:hypothetical protein LZ198_05790 [Myxococcus sp. K15C18031901]|uniref:WD40 repeat domain-containing protein n=1 Tax=Myxococcus dinghuensis TaxID=2906761 RepID=UPI0020A6E98A|nr:hypothetical protein [Myxococcus dinghuensis]MCP3098389.1 hypothetical protein [Myxococcus dinghuensis]